MRPILVCLLLLLANPVAAQTTPTDCDRLAGYDHSPRRDGLPGVYVVSDPAAAIVACQAALAAAGADPFLNFLLARALLAANPQDSRAVPLAEAGRAASASFADSRLGLWHEEGLAGLVQDAEQGLALSTQACAAWPDRMARAGCNNMANAMIERSGSDLARAEGFDWMDRLCDTDLAIACRNMGEYLRAGEVAVPDLPRALAYLDRGCDLGNGDSCGMAGYQRELGEGVATDIPAANALYRRGCDIGDAWSCYSLGYNFIHAVGTETDWDAGMALLDRACAGGSDHGCYERGLWLMHGRDNNGDVTPEGRAQALADFDRLCAADYAEGCTELGFAYQHGLAVVPDMVRALGFHDRGCALGDGMGCNNLGVHYARGLGVPADQPRALALYTQGCDAGTGLACFNQGELLAGPELGTPDPAAARAAYARACDLGHAEGCAVP